MSTDRDQAFDLMMAAFSDEAKTQRVAEIMSAAKKHEDAKLAAEAQMLINQKILEDAKQEHLAATDALSEQRKLEAELAAREAEWGRLTTELNEEKARFSKAREDVDAEQLERHNQQEKREAAMDMRETDLRKREAVIGEREAAAKTMHEAAARHAERLRAALADE